MKTKCFFIISCSTAFALTTLSCVKADVTLLRIVPDTQVTLCTRTEGDIPAGIPGKFPEDRSICLSGRYTGPSGSIENEEYFKNVFFRHRQNGEWSEDILWPPSGNVEVFGYSAQYFDDVSFVRWGDKCTERIDMHLNDNSVRQDDILFGAGSGEAGKSACGRIGVQFSHALSLLTFVFDENEGQNSGVTIDGISVDDIFCEADLAAYNEMNGIRYEWKNLGSRHNVEIKETGLIVIPQACSRMKVRFTVTNGDGLHTSFEKSVSADNGMLWAPGTNYEYHIRIRQSEVYAQVSAEPWKTDSILMKFK